MPLRTGIVGAGKVAPIHAGILASLPESQFVGVCSRTMAGASALAALYGVPAFDSVESLIATSGVQVLIICSPHPAHAANAVPALERGVHVLVEKPLAASLEDCDRMIEAAKRGGAVLGVISQRRWLEPVRRVKAAIDAGKIAKPILAVATMLSWRDQAYYESDPWRGRWDTEGGGVLVNQSPHLLDLLLWYMGEIDTLYGQWANFNHPYIEVDDSALAVIRFRSGALGSLLVSNSQKPGLYVKVEVHGSSGASVGVQTEGGAAFIAGMKPILEPPANTLWTIPGEEADLPVWRETDAAFFQTIDPAAYYFRLQIQDFLDSIQSFRPPAVTGLDGRRVVELFTALYRSQSTNQPVQFPL
jgi:predicted dehydrogenase